MDAQAAVIAEAEGYEVVTRALDPATLGGGLFGRFRARRKLRRAAACAGADGLVLLVERPGDAAWRPWMAYAAGAGLRPVAVPARLKGVDNIAGVRSGVAVYGRLAPPPTSTSPAAPPAPKPSALPPSRDCDVDGRD